MVSPPIFRPVQATPMTHLRTNVRTPHSGYHYDGRRNRFFEGWYFKVTVPQTGDAFALIYSIEDPRGGQFSGAGAQIMGPDDSYLIQYSKDVSNFWAAPDELELGNVFQPGPLGIDGNPTRRMLPQDDFSRKVKLGFQASATWHQGSIVAAEQGASGSLPSTVSSARWAFTVKPELGWGNEGGKQKATAGWLAALPVFEPHWQVMMAKGLATGWIEWGGRRIEFTDAPSYSEKNWGGGFPKKWFWVQCEDFEDEPTVALTSVGATRGILGLPGIEEDVGMIGLHHAGVFYELVPWAGEVQWEVDPWGKWQVIARNKEFEAVLEATCESPGTPLRAPTPKDGLNPICRDSFYGKCRVRLWRLGSNGERQGDPIVDARSSRAAVETGGGPWWDTWRTRAEMREPLRSLVKAPIDPGYIASWLPSSFRPRGL